MVKKNKSGVIKIHVIGQRIRANELHDTLDPVYKIIRGSEEVYAFNFQCDGALWSRYVQGKEGKPLADGARVWLETSSQVTLFDENGTEFAYVTPEAFVWLPKIDNEVLSIQVIAR